jgi:hypothetical protein
VKKPRFVAQANIEFPKNFTGKTIEHQGRMLNAAAMKVKEWEIQVKNHQNSKAAKTKIHTPITLSTGAQAEIHFPHAEHVQFVCDTEVPDCGMLDTADGHSKCPECIKNSDGKKREICWGKRNIEMRLPCSMSHSSNFWHIGKMAFDYWVPPAYVSERNKLGYSGNILAKLAFTEYPGPIGIYWISSYYGISQSYKL